MRATKLLKEEHEIILRGLQVLDALAGKAMRGEEVPAKAVGELLEFLGGFADAHHHGKEEEILFPAMERAGFPRDGGPLAVMLQEHEEGRALIATLRKTAARAGGTQGERTQFAVAARGYAQLLSAHIDKENQVLFVMADRVIAPDEQRRVDEAFDAFERDFGARRALHEAAVGRLSSDLGTREVSWT
ncbi:MAG: hemerythrin domain-containing protein [Myxococcales bacterium]